MLRDIGKQPALNHQEHPVSTALRVDYRTNPSQYRHWKLKFEGPVATLAADFDENAGLRQLRDEMARP